MGERCDNSVRHPRVRNGKQVELVRQECLLDLSDISTYALFFFGRIYEMRCGEMPIVFGHDNVARGMRVSGTYHHECTTLPVVFHSIK